MRDNIRKLYKVTFFIGTSVRVWDRGILDVAQSYPNATSIEWTGEELDLDTNTRTTVDC